MNEEEEAVGGWLALATSTFSLRAFPTLLTIYIFLDLNICYQSQERSTYEQPGLVADPLSAVSK